MKRYKIRNRL